MAAQSSQLRFTSVTAHAFRQHRKACLKYMEDHKAIYRTWAALIEPNRGDSHEVWGRLAFSVLSARERFPATCAAWEDVRHLGPAGVLAKTVPALKVMMRGAGLSLPGSKTRALRALSAQFLNNGAAWFLRWDCETWHSYRLRLTGVFGLGLAKASFAVCLLYPTTADVACLDTWMLKVFDGPKAPGLPYYLQTERKVRHWGFLVGVPTFIAQWMVWDHARGTQENHGILAGFPGAHKDSEEPL